MIAAMSRPVTEVYILTEDLGLLKKIALKTKNNQAVS